MSTEEAYKEPVRNYFINGLVASLAGAIILPDSSTDTVDTSTEVALPGYVFDAESIGADRVWYDMTLTTPSSTQSFLGTGAWRHYTGYFNVFINCPLAFGEAKDLCYAQPVLDTFAMGRQYTDDKVEINCVSADIIGSEKNDTYNRWQVAVRIVFRAELKS